MNFRKITEADCPQINAAIEADPFHAGKGTSEFFFEPFSEAFAVGDSEGDVMYVRISRALRVNAVFAGDARRNKEVMTNLAKVLAKQAEDSGFREVVFTSENPKLRAFGETIGFAAKPDLVMPVEPKEKSS
jgi:hypothetical protein